MREVETALFEGATSGRAAPPSPKVCDLEKRGVAGVPLGLGRVGEVVNLKPETALRPIPVVAPLRGDGVDQEDASAGLKQAVVGARDELWHAIGSVVDDLNADAGVVVDDHKRESGAFGAGVLDRVRYRLADQQDHVWGSGVVGAECVGGKVARFLDRLGRAWEPGVVAHCHIHGLPFLGPGCDAVGMRRRRPTRQRAVMMGGQASMVPHSRENVNMCGLHLCRIPANRG